MIYITFFKNHSVSLQKVDHKVESIGSKFDKHNIDKVESNFIKFENNVEKEINSVKTEDDFFNYLLHILPVTSYSEFINYIQVFLCGKCFMSQ